jgi:hypothetical protein
MVQKNSPDGDDLGGVRFQIKHRAACEVILTQTGGFGRDVLNKALLLFLEYQKAPAMLVAKKRAGITVH